MGPQSIHRCGGQTIAGFSRSPCAGEFTFDSALTSAHVSPGEGPFTGAAGYASPGRWTGSLAVSFPGRDDVPLTGPDFRVNLRNR
jgi:hypothetical protein